MDEKQARQIAGEWVAVALGEATEDREEFERRLWKTGQALIELVPYPDEWAIVPAQVERPSLPEVDDGGQIADDDLLVLGDDALYHGTLGEGRLGIVVAIRRLSRTNLGIPAVVEWRVEDHGADRRFRHWMFQFGDESIAFTTDRITNSSAPADRDEQLALALAVGTGWEIDSM